MGTTLKIVPIAEIRENEVALRAVDHQSEVYMGMVDSIRAVGILNPPSAREKTDPVTGATYYELVDGLHRYTCAKDAGLAEVPVHILTMEDGEVLEAQIMANVHKQEMRPADYTKQLIRLMGMNPLMTEADLAAKLCKSPSWISQRLSLVKIVDETIKSLVNEGKIKLVNAYALAKLPAEEQKNWVDRAITEGPDEFTAAIQTRKKEMRDASRRGEDVPPPSFEPIAKLRRATEMKEELESGAAARALRVADPASFRTGVEWALQLDAPTIESAQAKWEARQAERDEAKRARDVERAKKKQELADKAAKEAAEITASLQGDSQAEEAVDII